MTALLQPPLVNVISNQLQPIVALIDCSRSFFFFFFSVRSSRSSAHLHWQPFHCHATKKIIGNRPVEQAKKMKFIKD